LREQKKKRRREGAWQPACWGRQKALRGDSGGRPPKKTWRVPHPKKAREISPLPRPKGDEGVSDRLQGKVSKRGSTCRSGRRKTVQRREPVFVGNMSVSPPAGRGKSCGKNGFVKTWERKASGGQARKQTFLRQGQKEASLVNFFCK